MRRGGSTFPPNQNLAHYLFHFSQTLLLMSRMPGCFRALIAGWGAKKLGGGCLSTIVIFLLIYWLLGQCN